MRPHFVRRLVPLATIGAAALATCSLAVGCSGPAPSRGQLGATRSPSSDGRGSVTTEAIGPVPSVRIFFEPGNPNRLHAGGWTSDDGGRSWQLLTGEDGMAIVPVGGVRHERPCAASRRGRVLCAEVIFQQGSETTGQGQLAGAAEWTGTAWAAVIGASDATPVYADTGLPAFGGDGSILAPRGRSDTIPGPPVMRVRAVGYLSDGTWAAATDDTITFGSRGTVACPAAVRDFAVASDGKIYVAADRDTGFGLYVADGLVADWLPVAGAAKVTSVVEGAAGVVVAGDHLGRGRGTAFQWTAWPLNYRIQRIVAHPTAPLVAAWGWYGEDRALLLSRDGGRTIEPVRLPPGTGPVWAAFDPATTKSLLIVDSSKTLYRVAVGPADRAD